MPKFQRQERLAINLEDLHRVDQSIRAKLIGSRLDLEHPISTEFDDGRKGVAVPFSCDLLTAAIVCDYLRNLDRQAGDDETRIYIKKETWSRVWAYQELTIPVGEEVYLNPELFGCAELPKLPPKVRRMD